MERIKDTIKNVMVGLEKRKRSKPKDNPEAMLRKVFPKKGMAHIQLNYFRNGILSIKVDSSSWLYHLSLQKEDLLFKLRKKSKAVQEIRFCLGEIK